MSDPIQCDVHGPSEATFVCEHICASMTDLQARGFNWSREDGEYQATCDVCRSTTEEEWAAVSGKVIRMICFGCFQEAAAINGAALGAETLQ